MLESTASFAPRLAAKPKPQPAPEASKAAVPAQSSLPLVEVKVVNRLSENHAEMLRAALRDLGDARKILDPGTQR